MIIEQVEALKAWLTTKLSPICDAEPSALAKYVCALVKKDKPEEDLRDICLDQLDVFLQLKTKPFVDELFETLKSKSYITAEEKKPQPVPVTRLEGKRAPPPAKDKDEPAKKKVAELSSSTNDKEPKDDPNVKESKEKDTGGDTSTTTGSKDVKEPPRDGKEPKEVSRDNKEPRALSREGREREGERDRRDSWREERNREGIRDARDIIREREGRDTREVREPRDRDRDYRRRRTRSRSHSPRRNYMGLEERRRRYDDRHRYSPDRRWRRRSFSRSPRRNRSPLPRLRSKSPRLRSRSPRLRSRSPRFRSFRSRTRSRSRSLRARSWSRPGSGGGFPRSGSPFAQRQPDSRGSTPFLENDYSTLISSSTNELPSVSSTVGPNVIGEGRLDGQGPVIRAPIQGARSRCTDFEEKGFCMMGDMCPYDHGTDPVVVEDVPLPNVIPGSAPPSSMPPTGPGFVPPDLRVPPPMHMGVRVNMRRPPPNMVEPYLPEAPGLRGPPPQAFMRGIPPNIRPPPPRMMMNQPPMERMMLPPREIMIEQPSPGPEDDDLDPLIGDKEPSRIVIPAKRPYNAIEETPGAAAMGAPPLLRLPHINQRHHLFGQNQPVSMPVSMPFVPQMAGPPRKGFDFNRLGRGGNRQFGNRPAFKTGNLTLEVRKIPAELNNIAKINEHFGKFGTLTNIQVKYQGDISAALITFSNNGEATAAYKSPEPVFNNRFIKLFWHNPDKGNSEDNASGEGQKAPGQEGQIPQRTGGRVGDGIDHPSLVLPPRSTIPPAHKLFLDNTKPKPGAVPTTSTTETASTSESDKSSIVYTSSMGHLKKTMFNATTAAGPSKVKAVPITSPTATSKPADFVSRIEAIKRAEENKKIATIKQAELGAKKQELLAKQIQQQKLLIQTLDKKKATMSEKEKASLLKALKTISDAIDKVKYSGGVKKESFQAPAPSQMKFVSREQAASVAPTFPYGRGRGWAGSQGSSWSSRGRGRGGAVAIGGHTSLDNRPKTIEIKDFDLEELEEVKLHFQKFGEFEKVDLVESIPSIFITFTFRMSAEMALAHGKKFKSKNLTIRWNQMMQILPRTESVQSSELDDEDLSVTLGSLEEEALRNISGEKPEASTPSTTNQSFAETSTPEPVQTETRSVVEDSAQEGSAAASIQKRSLSEDLLLNDEHNFKASYTDDEDEEDHITVTISSTITNPSWVYTGESSRRQETGTVDDDLANELDSLAEANESFSVENETS